MITKEKTLTESLYSAFRSDDGRIALAWILNECGVFSTSPQSVDPSLIAFAGRLMEAAGMGIEGHMGRYVNSLIESYDGPSDR